MKVFLTANTSFALVNFRGGLIRALREDGHQLIALVPRDDYTPALVEAGCNVIDLPMDRRGTTPHREARTFVTIIKAIHNVRPDAIFSYTIKNNLYAGLAARWMKIPFVPNVTGLGTIFSNRTALTILAQSAYKKAFQKAHVVFFQNREDRARFTREGLVSSERARLLPGSGVDLDRFKVALLPSIGDDPAFLLVARLLWEKGIGEYVTAARIVRAKYPKARFDLLGALERSGPTAVPKSTLEAWTAEGLVNYLGTSRDVRPILESSDCVVLPSYYREGTPRVLLEAAACGRPIVTTDMPGCRDVVENGVSGFLVKPRDGEELGELLLQVSAASAKERTKLGLAGRARMEKFYDENTVIRVYQDVLKEIAQTN